MDLEDKSGRVLVLVLQGSLVPHPPHHSPALSEMINEIDSPQSRKQTKERKKENILLSITREGNKLLSLRESHHSSDVKVYLDRKS